MIGGLIVEGIGILVELLIVYILIDHLLNKKEKE